MNYTDHVTEWQEADDRGVDHAAVSVEPQVRDVIVFPVDLLDITIPKPREYEVLAPLHRYGVTNVHIGAMRVSTLTHLDPSKIS
ncbi:hypothetical protein GCM10023097_59750 [Streptomyces collinus]